jgi:hypothetical protein
MVMLLGRTRALIAHYPLPDLHALHQVQLLELVEDPIDARAADAPPTWAGLGALNVRDAEHTRLRRQQLEKCAARATALVTGGCERRLGELDPFLTAHLSHLVSV